MAHSANILTDLERLHHSAPLFRFAEPPLSSAFRLGQTSTAPRRVGPADRPIDGVDQTAVLLGKTEQGARETLLTFIGPDLVAARWNQWRLY